MKKRFIIILSIQTILILLMMVYAFIQKLEADKSRMAAEQNLMEAQRQERIANEIMAHSQKLELELLQLKKENQSK